MTAFDPKRTFRPAILAFIFANGVVVIPGFLLAKAPVAAAPINASQQSAFGNLALWN
jgi:hypothetical protein